MKYLLIALACLCLVSCTDHQKVMWNHRTGNKHASDLLLNGLNMRNASYIDSRLITDALNGDEQSKHIIYAQINSLGVIPFDRHHVTPVVIPIRSGRR